MESNEQSKLMSKIESETQKQNRLTAVRGEEEMGVGWKKVKGLDNASEWSLDMNNGVWIDWERGVG